MMKTKFACLIGLLIPFLSLSPQGATADILQIRVDLSEQRMRVYLDNRRVFLWPISSARRGKITPLGTYQPQFLSANHRSSLYNNAPMPWSVFFHGHYAIHGTNEVSKLGRPASAGCIRLHPDHAKQLFALVQKNDKSDTYIVVQP
jgi:lipoprotein-anchoring transpeptidase ErfK/SrfK